jgi:hypothetical protein
VHFEFGDGQQGLVRMALALKKKLDLDSIGEKSINEWTQFGHSTLFKETSLLPFLFPLNNLWGREINAIESRTW